jgi:hypothetical protein
MTTQVHRTRPFVNQKGALTQWGWGVLNSLRTATGGPQTTPGEALLFAVFGPTGTASPVTAGAVLSVDVGPVFVNTIGPDDLGPV